MPFLRRVTAGRSVPEQRLAAVAEHYHHFGGVSPINAQNRALLAAIETQFAARNIDLPLYWGNRNWHPLLADTVATMRADGVRRALVLATSATGSYSGCRQYLEDLASARRHVGTGAPQLVKLRHYFDHPGLIDANADRLRSALAQVAAQHGAQRAAKASLVFTAHSIPEAMDATAGLSGHLYSAQQRETARLVQAAVRGTSSGVDLAWQSRSGPPHVPWLGPDVNDRLRALAAEGASAVVVAPTGFVSDHVEVLWDLDVEARATAESVGLAFARAATVGTHPAFVQMIAELVDERLCDTAPVGLGRLGRTGIDCPASCCPAPGGPAVSG